MKRILDESDEAAVVNILALLPREIVLHMLETGHLSIADVFIFCQTNVWSFQLCNDLYIWERVYNARFPDLELRQRVDALLSNIPEEVIFRVEEITGILQFGPPIRVVTMMGDDDGEAQNEIISIVNQICGPPDEDDKWTRDLGVLTPLFRKMIIYKILDHGFSIDEPAGPIDRRIDRRRN